MGRRTDIDEATFEAARSAVEEYFGDLIDAVALEAPVSRAMLVSAMTCVQVAATRRRSLLESKGVREGGADGAVVFSLYPETWTVLTGAHQLSTTEAMAVQAVHHRMARALGIEVDGTRRSPLVHVDRSGNP